MWDGTCHKKGSNFQSLSGTGCIPLYKFWERAQIYLSEKGSLLVRKGAVKLTLPGELDVVEPLSKQIALQGFFFIANFVFGLTVSLHLPQDYLLRPTCPNL